MSAKITSMILMSAAARYRSGESLRELAIEYGCSTEGLRTAIKSTYPKIAMQRQHVRQCAKMKSSPHCGQIDRGPRLPPPEVMAEAIRAMSAPRDITAIICGDPPLGRRAIDRRP
jgi:hypothetical protein